MLIKSIFARKKSTISLQNFKIFLLGIVCQWQMRELKIENNTILICCTHNYFKWLERVEDIVSHRNDVPMQCLEFDGATRTYSMLVPQLWSDDGNWICETLPNNVDAICYVQPDGYVIFAIINVCCFSSRVHCLRCYILLLLSSSDVLFNCCGNVQQGLHQLIINSD